MQIVVTLGVDMQHLWFVGLFIVTVLSPLITLFMIKFQTMFQHQFFTSVHYRPPMCIIFLPPTSCLSVSHFFSPLGIVVYNTVNVRKSCISFYHLSVPLFSTTVLVSSSSKLPTENWVSSSLFLLTIFYYPTIFISCICS